MDTALPDCEICGEPALRVLCDAREVCFERLLPQWRSAADALESLRRLVTPFGFELVSAHGDRLPPTAGRDLAPWAYEEEKCVRSMQLRWMEGEDRAGSQLAHAPWLDVYWKRVL